MNEQQQLCSICHQSFPISSIPMHTLVCLCSRSRGDSNNSFSSVFTSDTINDFSLFDTFLLGDDSLYTNHFAIPQRHAYTPFGWMQASHINMNDVDTVEDSIDDYNYNIFIADLLGNVEVGFTDAQIKDLSELVDSRDCSEQRCPVCLEDYADIEGSITRLKCQHSFCTGCIKTWLYKHKKCPSCQVDLEDAYLTL